MVKRVIIYTKHRFEQLENFYLIFISILHACYYIHVPDYTYVSDKQQRLSM